MNKRAARCTHEEELRHLNRFMVPKLLFTPVVFLSIASSAMRSVCDELKSSLLKK